MSLISHSTIYHGKVLNLDLDRVRFPDGSSGELEMIRHPGAAAVLPFLDDPGASDPRVIMVHQFRHAADGQLWEIPAGRLEPGEDPEDCARRELAEETGYRTRSLHHMLTIYTTPGFTDEKIHLFTARVGGRGSHLRDRDEFMEVTTLRWSEIGRMVASGQICDGKTLCALFYAQQWGRSAAVPG